MTGNPAMIMGFLVQPPDQHRTALKELFQRHNTPVLEVHSGELLLEFLDQHPDASGLVITESELPMMSGRRLINKLTSMNYLVSMMLYAETVCVNEYVETMKRQCLPPQLKPSPDDIMWNQILDGLSVAAKWRGLKRELDEVNERLRSLDKDTAATLPMFLEGKRIPVIAQSMGVSRRTIERRKQTIFNTFDVFHECEVQELMLRMRAIQLELDRRYLSSWESEKGHGN
ncbi:MAG: hypothetical protein AAFP69_01025 [Planctomycetota bacterium]